MTEAKPAMSALRRRMIDDMTLRNLSPATQRSYLHAVTKFSRHFGCSPDWLGLEDVRSFQVHLVSQGISWPALNQTVDLAYVGAVRSASMMGCHTSKIAATLAKVGISPAIGKDRSGAPWFLRKDVERWFVFTRDYRILVSRILVSLTISPQ